MVSVNMICQMAAKPIKKYRLACHDQTKIAHVKDDVFATTILQATESGPNVKMEKPSINGGKSIIVQRKRRMEVTIPSRISMASASRWYWVEGHFGTEMGGSCNARRSTYPWNRRRTVRKH